MNNKVTSIVALVCWIAAVWLLLPFDASFNTPQFSAPKAMAAAVGMGVLVNVYRSFIKPQQNTV